MFDEKLLQAAFPDIKIKRLLKESGQRFVYEAVRLGTPVALKVFRPDQADMQRVAREISAVAAMKCDYVPTIFDFGQRSVGADPILPLDQG